LDSKIALSIDIEDWYHTPAITGSSFSKYKDVNAFFAEWKGEYDLITQPTLKIIELLKKFELKATFFVVADTIDRYPQIITALKDSDHEIACHGLHHHAAIDGKTKKMLQTLSTWKSELFEAKTLLEKTFQKEIIGYRAPGGYFATWMVPVLEEAGFKYDSSISQNSLYNKTDIISLQIPNPPYRLGKNDLSDKEPLSEIIELPWASVRLFGMNWPVGGAFFFRALGLNFFKFALRKNLKLHDTMFYFHSLDISEGKIPLFNFKKRPFYWINKGKVTYKRIEKLLLAFSENLVPCEQVYKNTMDRFNATKFQ
jgi:peptidoglycan-N-acetylglucosamine deacetylase